MNPTRIVTCRSYQQYQTHIIAAGEWIVALALFLLPVLAGAHAAASGKNSPLSLGKNESAMRTWNSPTTPNFRVSPPAPQTVECYTSNTTWQNDTFPSESTPFFAAFDATPNSASIDGVTGMSLGPALSYANQAVTTRFNLAQMLDARDAAEYRADTILPYVSGLTYHFLVLVYPATHVFTVYVTPPGAPQIVLGANLNFRDGQGSTSSFDNWCLFTEAGSHTVCGFNVWADTSSDVTPPTVSIAGPVAGAIVSGTTAISANASDDVGVAGVQIKVDEKPIGAELTTAPYIQSWDSTAFPNGTHILTATARDAAGNAATSAPVSVTVENQPAAACPNSTSVWQNIPIATQTSPFEVAFDDTPNNANMDGVTGVAMGNSVDFNFLSVIIRFNTSGFIDARNGSAYAANASVPYSAGSTYHFRGQIDPAGHHYNIFVTPPGSQELTLGSNFAFRTERSNGTSLDTWALFADIGSHSVCNFSVGAITNPPQTLTGFSLNPSTVTGGNSSTATITLSGPAPPDGAVVSIGSAVAAAQIPSAVTVPATQSGTTFTIPTAAVTATQSGNITATYNGRAQSALLTVNPAPATSIKYVQGRAANGRSVSSKSLAFTSANTAGNLLVVGVDWSDTQSFGSISDSAGNSYAEVGSELRVAGKFRLRLYYAKNVPGGANTVKVILSGTVATVELYLQEYSGANHAAPLDAQSGAIGTSSSASSGSAITSAANDLVFGYCVTGRATAGAGFTVRSSLDSNLTEDKTVAAAGSVSATATASSSWALQMAAFRQ